MNANYYNGEPGAMPYDDDDWRKPSPRERNLPKCSKCGSTGPGLISMSPGGIRCRECEWRRLQQLDVVPEEGVI